MKRIPRILLSLNCLAILAVGVAGEETPGDRVTLDPSLMTIVINKAVHNKGQNEEGIFEGGVTIWYERIRLASEMIHYWQSPIGAAKAQADQPPVGGTAVDTVAAATGTGKDAPPNYPEKIHITAGPNGPEPDRVHFDTRFTELPTINFRGLLRPTELLLERLPLDPARPGVVTFRVSIPGMGDFKGYLLRQESVGPDGKRQRKWVPCVAYSNQTEITIEADYESGSLHNPRIRNITLIAPEEVDAAGKDYVMLEVHDPEYPGRVMSKGRIILEFGEDGRLGDQKALGYTLIKGMKPGAPDMSEAFPEVTPEEMWDEAGDGNKGRVKTRRETTKPAKKP